MKRVLFATFGSVGDVHPYMAVAHAVRELGGEPTIAIFQCMRGEFALRA
jgi:UDP:flavonoid glycosyltransferase YjiC (YdhE family)